MKQVLIFSIIAIIPFLAIGQTSYDKKVLGKWHGTIYGGGLKDKSITIVITSSDYRNGGNCEGYSLVNNGNKTPFIGKIIVEGDLPILNAYEPKTSPKNGKFYLDFGCSESDEIDTNHCCGTWESFDEKIKRKIRLEKAN